MFKSFEYHNGREADLTAAKDRKTAPEAPYTARGIDAYHAARNASERES